MIQAIQNLLDNSGRAIIPDVGCLSMSDDGTIVFNTFLKFNDGKLTAWLMQNEGLDEASASQKVQSWSEEIRNKVLSGQEFPIGNIGKFIPEGKDEIEFTTKLDQEVAPVVSTDKQAEPNAQEEIKENETNIQVTVKEEEQPDDIKDSDSKNEEENLEKNHERNTVAGEERSANSQEEVSQNESVAENKDSGLDDILNKSNQAQEAEITESHEESSSEQVETNQALENEKTDSNPVEQTGQSEKVIQEEKTVKKNKKEKKTAKPSEEVTVKRKRSAFFYINIVLLVLILGLGAFAFIYTDEVSAWLGISEPKTEQVKDVKSTPDVEEFEPLAQEEEPESIDEATPIEQEEIVQTPTAVAPPQEEPKPEPKPDPKPAPKNDIPAVASSGDFHIIVGKFTVQENADRLVQKIRDAGYDGKIIRSTSTGHTVSFHAYPSFQDANNNIEKAKEITGTGAYIEKK